MKKACILCLTLLLLLTGCSRRNQTRVIPIATLSPTRPPVETPAPGDDQSTAPEESAGTDEQTPTGQKRGESAATQEIKDAEVTTVLNAGLPEEETTILGAAGMEVSLVKPTADGVLLLPEETKTQAGTVVHILDLIVTHTGETIS